MECITAPTREAYTDTAKESAIATNNSEFDDKQRAVPSPVQVAEAFKSVESLAEKYDLSDASMHLRRAKRAFIASYLQNKSSELRQTVVTELFTSFRRCQ